MVINGEWRVLVSFLFFFLLFLLFSWHESISLEASVSVYDDDGSVIFPRLSRKTWKFFRTKFRKRVGKRKFFC